MTLEELAEKTAECRAAGWDVQAMRSDDVFNRDIPDWVRDVLGYELVRRWAYRRSMELTGAAA